MSVCCGGFCAAAEHQFDARRAKRDVKRYRRRGPDVTTRLLRDGLVAASPLEGTLLDIGAGIGPLTFELLDAGIESAHTVDASPASISAGRDEAARRSRSPQIEWHRGDFVSLAEGLATADIVTLDRVVCCYPAFEPLLEQALAHARRFVAFSYPRDLWYVRSVLGLDNGVRRIRGNPFRSFVHSTTSMETFVHARGFDLVSRSSSVAWTADVYTRMRP